MASEQQFHIKYVCNTPATRQSGLMFKPKLKPDECAFFTFNYADYLSFWNKNVSFDIAVIFADQAQKIQNVEILRAFQESPSVTSKTSCMYVIEVSVENFEKIKSASYFVKEGDYIKIVKEDSSTEFFENGNFQKIANKVYKNVR